MKLDNKKFCEIEKVLRGLVSGEIKSACIMIEGIIITSSGSDFESGIDNAITAQLMVAGRIVEEALAIREKNFERMVITANGEVVGGFDIIMQRAGPNAFIIVESKGIIPGSPLGYISGNGKVGGTFTRIDEVAEEIAKLFLDQPTIDEIRGVVINQNL